MIICHTSAALAFAAAGSRIADIVALAVQRTAAAVPRMVDSITSLLMSTNHDGSSASGGSGEVKERGTVAVDLNAGSAAGAVRRGAAATAEADAEEPSPDPVLEAEVAPEAELSAGTASGASLRGRPLPARSTVGTTIRTGCCKGVWLPSMNGGIDAGIDECIWPPGAAAITRAVCNNLKAATPKTCG